MSRVKFTRGKFLWHMTHNQHAVSCHEALIGNRCCGEWLEADTAFCPLCSLPHHPDAGLVIGIDEEILLMRRRGADEDIQQVIRDYIDDRAKHREKAKKKKEPDADDPLAKTLQTIGWPGRAAALFEEMRRRLKDN